MDAKDRIKIFLSNMESQIQESLETRDAKRKEDIIPHTEHHKSWDNHVLTLSSGALGLIFFGLKVDEWKYTDALLVSIFLFVLTIILAIAAYNFANKTFLKSNEHIGGITEFVHDLRSLLYKFQNDIADTNNDDEINAVVKSYNETMSGKTRDYNIEVDAVNDYINRYNARTTRFNELKTYTFIFGIIFLTVATISNKFT